jgi:hypothetical protein
METEEALNRRKQKHRESDKERRKRLKDALWCNDEEARIEAKDALDRIK